MSMGSNTTQPLGRNGRRSMAILRMPGLNATEMAVAACLIDHAHDEHGFAFPSRESIQHWTGGRSKSAVDRALGKLKGLGLIEGVERRLNYTKSETTLYLITWQPFFNAFQKVEAWKSERRNATRNAGGVVPAYGSGWFPQSGQVVPGNGEHISLTYLSNEDLSRSRLRRPTEGFSSRSFWRDPTDPQSQWRGRRVFRKARIGSAAGSGG